MQLLVGVHLRLVSASSLRIPSPGDWGVLYAEQGPRPLYQHDVERPGASAQEFQQHGRRGCGLAGLPAESGGCHACYVTMSLCDVSEASSTCGISGLPFTFQDEEGEERQVADGAFKNFLPTLDETSITVKPFCAGVDVLKLTGQRADVGPSEFVPGSFGVFPPPRTLLQHLYELGYRDTETWLQLHLEERLQEVAEKNADAEAEDTGPESV